MANLKKTHPTYIRRIAFREDLNNLCTNFRPASPYNQYLFDLYYKRRMRNKKIEYCYVEPSIRLINYLQNHKIKEFKNWFDVYEESFSAKIGTTSGRDGCPIVYLGHLLEKENRIKYESKCYPIFLCLQDFIPESRIHVRNYFFNHLLKEHHIDTALYWLRIIQNCGKLVGGDLHAINNDIVLNFLKVQSTAIPTTELKEHFKVLTRFFNFLNSIKFSAVAFNFKIDRKIFYQCCTRCQKIKFISDYSKKCILCIYDISLLEFVAQMKFKIPDDKIYNQYIFDCYLTYLKRFRVDHIKWQDSKLFVEILCEYDFAPFKTWNDVRNASKLFKIKMGSRKMVKGCPFVKAGHILTELGVLIKRDLDFKTKSQISLNRLQFGTAKIFGQYMLNLQQRRRSYSTLQQVIYSVFYLETWAIENNQPDIFKLSRQQVKEFVLSVKKLTRDYHVGRLLNFFEWCHENGFASENHFQQFRRVGPNPQLPICSDEQIKLLLKFIKNKNADPAQAMMISLSMFWGFRTVDLVYSTFSVEQSMLQIKTYQSPISYGHKRPTRNEILNLPQNPRWFLDLQNRFIQQWKTKYETLSWSDRKNLPLFPSKYGVYPRAVSRTVLLEEFRLATTLATGKPISPKYIRCTSGHFNTIGSDAAVLSQVGWTKASAFNYTWYPRKYI